MPLLAACWPFRLFYPLLPQGGPDVLSSQLGSGDGGCHVHRPRVLALNALLLRGASVLSAWCRAPSPNHQHLQDIVKHQHNPLTPQGTPPSLQPPSSPTHSGAGDPGGTHSRDRAWLCWKRSSGRACSWLRFSRLRGRRKGSGAGEESCQPHPGHSFGSLQRARFQVMGANWALIDLLTILQLDADRTPSC